MPPAAGRRGRIIPLLFAGIVVVILILAGSDSWPGPGLDGIEPIRNQSRSSTQVENRSSTSQDESYVWVQSGPNYFGVFMRDTPAWNDRQNEILANGELLIVVYDGVWGDGVPWYYVRVADTGRYGYIPVELTTPDSNVFESEPTIAPIN